MKEVLISIRSEWVSKILHREKTVEVRKTRPKIKTPFKCYIYLTKGGFESNKAYGFKTWAARGKVVGEFICDMIAKLKFVEIGLTNVKIESDIPLDISGTCLTGVEIGDYVYGNYLNGMFKPARPFYGWHISDLKIYDKPKEISEFMRECDGYCLSPKNMCIKVKNKQSDIWANCNMLLTLTSPPRSWFYVEEL